MAKTLPEREKKLIEELKYENQMNNLQPWIKALYKQVEKDPTNPSGWSKWSLGSDRTPDLETGDYLQIFFTEAPLDGGGRQRVLNKFINSEENKDQETKEKERLVYLLLLSEQEKRFILLCNTVLGLGLTEGKFLGMSEVDKKNLRDRIIGA